MKRQIPVTLMGLLAAGFGWVVWDSVIKEDKETFTPEEVILPETMAKTQALYANAASSETVACMFDWSESCLLPPTKKKPWAKGVKDAALADCRNQIARFWPVEGRFEGRHAAILSSFGGEQGSSAFFKTVALRYDELPAPPPRWVAGVDELTDDEHEKLGAWFKFFREWRHEGLGRSVATRNELDTVFRALDARPAENATEIAEGHETLIRALPRLSEVGKLTVHDYTDLEEFRRDARHRRHTRAELATYCVARGISFPAETIVVVHLATTGKHPVGELESQWRPFFEGCGASNVKFDILFR